MTKETILHLSVLYSFSYYSKCFHNITNNISKKHYIFRYGIMVFMVENFKKRLKKYTYNIPKNLQITEYALRE